MMKILTACSLVLMCLANPSPLLAKLAPPSDEAKAKTAETAAKAAHGNKVADFELCKAMDRTAAAYRASAKKAGKETKPATGTTACADPGVFVYTPPAATAPAVASAAPAAPKK